MRHAALFALVLPVVAACDPEASGGAGETGADPSPNAKILPAPLATQMPGVAPSAQGGIPADSAGRLLTPDAGPPLPEPMPTDRALAPEQLGTEEPTGVALEAQWRWRDVPPPADAAEVDKAAVEEARKRLRHVWAIELTNAGRMRVRVDSDAQPLPRGTELRSRLDRYGYVLLWPDGATYRVVAPGALRTVVGERRLDVSPLSSGRVTSGERGKRLEIETRTVTIKTSYGELTLELASVPEAGAGSELLCRALIELAGVGPSLSVCEPTELPLMARFDWRNGGGVDFEVTALNRAPETLSSRDTLVPPPTAQYRVEGIPAAPAGIFVDREGLASIRTADAEVTPGKDAPGEGITVRNETEVLLYFVLDGLPVAAVPPLADRYIVGPRPGRYNIQWRTFLGDRVDPARVELVPGRVTVAVSTSGDADAGAP